MNFELGKMSGRPFQDADQAFTHVPRANAPHRRAGGDATRLVARREQVPIHQRNHSIYICSFNEEKDGSVSVAFSAWRACVLPEGGREGVGGGGIQGC